jgi:glycosyltransferase involved in cell wall biosynthesis
MAAAAERRTVLSVFGLEPKKVGGVEAYARELSRQLGERDWHSVLCFLSPPTPLVRDYFNLPNVTLESLEGAATGVEYLRRLICLLRRYRPVILHLHLVALFGPYALIARLLGVKAIFYTDHSSRPAGFVGEIQPLWKRLLFRGMMAPLKRILCISNYVRDSFNSLGLLPPDRSIVVYNAVDLERVEAGMANAAACRKSFNIHADSFLVVQVGQIIPEKGVPDLLEAAARVCNDDRTVQFLFVGDGEYLPEYRSRVVRLGLAGRIMFTGPLADPLATGVFAAADLDCQVSRWEEGFGLVIAEAMAAAKPVLATRSGGIPELVTHGVTGYTVERGDDEAMATHILTLSKQRDLGTALGIAGQRVCREKFDHRRNVRQVLNIYGIF